MIETSYQRLRTYIEEHHLLIEGDYVERCGRLSGIFILLNLPLRKHL